MSNPHGCPRRRCPCHKTPFVEDLVPLTRAETELADACALVIRTHIGMNLSRPTMRNGNALLESLDDLRGRMMPTRFVALLSAKYTKQRDLGSVLEVWAYHGFWRGLHILLDVGVCPFTTPNLVPDPAVQKLLVAAGVRPHPLAGVQAHRAWQRWHGRPGRAMWCCQALQW